ncbi:MAG: hypothetical protein JWP46_602 [Modestobacter sp.]|nr:hypothetical protein [Modestobacter sp.]
MRDGDPAVIRGLLANAPLVPRLMLPFVGPGPMRATPAACTGRSRRKSDPAGPARSTPPDIGDVGVFFDSAAGAERACSHDPPLPTTDRFRNQGGRDVLIGYVALDQAVTAATPGSRPEVFPTLQAEVSDLRLFADPTRAAAAHGRRAVRGHGVRGRSRGDLRAVG